MVGKKTSKNVSRTLKKSVTSRKKTSRAVAVNTKSKDAKMESLKKDSLKNSGFSVNDAIVWKVTTVILALVLVSMMVWNSVSTVPDSLQDGFPLMEKISSEELEINVKSFVEENLIQSEMTAEVISIEEERGVYKVTVNVDFGSGTGQNVTSYTTLDGKYFFANGLDMMPDNETDKDSADGSDSNDPGSPTGQIVEDSAGSDDDVTESQNSETHDENVGVEEPSVAMNEETIAACIEPFNVTPGEVIFYHSSGCGWCSKMVPGVENLETEGYNFHWAELTTGEGVDLVNQCYRKYITSGGVPQFICTTNANIKVGAFTDQNRDLDEAALKAFADACIAA